MSFNGDLFVSGEILEPWPETIAADACLLHGFALTAEAALRKGIAAVTGQAPFRHMITPGGHRMSAAMTSCGALGWVTDRSGYRYSPQDPESAASWPSMPDVFAGLARDAARAAGFSGFEPDACLINRYAAGARMGLHQDRNEQDFSAPIVSVSLGLPATFLFGGARRAERPARYPLVHGDVLVWGGRSRLNFHGIAPLKAGHHPFAGEQRINLTFRKAG